MASPSTSIGVNLRVTGHCNQGGRKYMEDVFSVAYQQTDDEKDLEYAFFGIFDGHGGREAALFAKEHLMDFITRQKAFWSEDDDEVLRAIREGFLTTQQAMWKDQPNWRPTASGLPSTAGTTASICFIKRGKIFVGHCGDSGIVIGERDPKNALKWRARPLTIDHKPESDTELKRIESSGGKVVEKSGVPRVVWKRPRGCHQGPIRRSTPIDEVPFLAVARALGDLWSYNPKDDVFVVSPDPDLYVHTIDVTRDHCLILATDGAWNVLSAEMAVDSVHEAELNNEKHMLEEVDNSSGHGDGLNGSTQRAWINPSKKLVDLAIGRWALCGLRADNTSIVTVMLDPPGPPRAQVLRRMREKQKKMTTGCGDSQPPALPPKRQQQQPGPPPPPPSTKGIAIISRFPNSNDEGEKKGKNLVSGRANALSGTTAAATRIVHDSYKSTPQKLKMTTSSVLQKPPEESIRNIARLNNSSPSPPPLPVRPNNLSRRPPEVPPPQPPNTRLRKASGDAYPPLSSVASGKQPPPRFAASECTSDSENDPQRAPPTTRPRRSLDVGASKQPRKNNPIGLKPLLAHRSRRSEPLPRPTSSVASSPKVLRPRNDGGTTQNLNNSRKRRSQESSEIHHHHDLRKRVDPHEPSLVQSDHRELRKRGDPHELRKRVGVAGCDGQQRQLKGRRSCTAGTGGGCDSAKKAKILKSNYK